MKSVKIIAFIHSNSLGNNAVIDMAGCYACNRKSIVTGVDVI